MARFNRARWIAEMAAAKGKYGRLIEQQHNRLRTIIESEPECVKLQDRDGVILEMNPAGLNLLDASAPGEVIGRTIYDFLIPEYQDGYRALSDQVFRGQRATMEFEVLSLHGERRWLETHAAPLLDSEGGVSALLAVTRDINERKHYEEQLRRQQTELAHVCRLSTMGEMASGLAHELNQPLCAISSYAESAQLLCGEEHLELRGLLDKIVFQSERASQIIHRAREFVRKQGPRPQPTAPATLVEETMQLVEAERRHQHIELDLWLEDDLPQLLADRIQIEQVLVNLVTNAIQAMGNLPYDQRRLSLAVSKIPGKTVEFSLCNHGEPIPAHVVQGLFLPFFTTKERGMGMGLAISRSIIEAHGGIIGYRDAPDGGACFYFHLPASKA
ncbi:MAG: PAS domain S-box protein [Gammaproteobacteria bacterium]|nr:PAS domain S-box protein [Gammaproteobacteria bacterium]